MKGYKDVITWTTGERDAVYLIHRQACFAERPLDHTWLGSSNELERRAGRARARTCHSALVRLEGHVRMNPAILFKAKAYGSERDDMKREMGD